MSHNMKNELPAHIAIIEDDPDIAALLQTSLQMDGFRTSSYGNGHSFRSVLDKIKPDVCLVDLGLPDQDGVELVETIISSSQAATIIISGRTGADEKINCLKIGADDYIVKPFEPDEVVARVHAVLRRTRKSIIPAKDQAVANFGNWQIDFNVYKLKWIGPEAGARDPVFLSHGEASVLKIFLDSANVLMTRTQILDKLTDDPDLNFDRSVDVRISRLRSKLEDDPRNPVLIKTVYGAGYLFVSNVKSLSS